MTNKNIEKAANTVIFIIYQTNYLLDQLIQKIGRVFYKRRWFKRKDVAAKSKSEIS